MKLNLLYSEGCLFRLGWITIIVLVILALLKHFVFDIMPVSGLSMYSSFDDGDLIVLNKISYVIGTPERGDSIVLRFPGDPNNERYIKRLVGLPGEKVTIKDGKVFINDSELFESYLDKSITTLPSGEVTLKDDQYYLLGDNRPVSSDSRVWGTASRGDFIGKAFAIIYPFDNATAITSPKF